MIESSGMQKNSPFKLMRWFGWLSSAVIVGIAVAHAWLISDFLSTQLFQREGELNRDFVQNILVADGSLDYLSNPQDPVLAARFAGTVTHLKNMHDLLRVNIYQTDGTLLWSTDSKLIGNRFPDDNEEFEEALKGEFVVNPVHISEWFLKKKEHVGIDPAIKYFIECYIPVLKPETGKVVGVVEFYRAPVALTRAVEEGRIKVWFVALASALALFGSLYWIVRRADKTIRLQHSRLIETETLAIVGELASSIAHNIRNPLSSIRSSAELALESPREDCTEQARDIIHDADRIGKQLAELLNFSAENIGKTSSVNLADIIERCVNDQRQMFERRRQTVTFSSSATHPIVSTDETLLLQVLHGLMANAAEAMEANGHCQVRLSDEDASALRIEIEDDGVGIAPDIKAQIFRPFFSTKLEGLGLGLAQARKIVERFGGTIEFLDHPGQGAIVKVVLPKA